MSEITVIDRNTFWELLAQAREACGQDLSAESDWLQRRLHGMDPEQALRFHHIAYRYSDLADQYGLWNAASILCRGCGDDGFVDFRGWLIAQGREAYLAALKDPDTLAELDRYGGCVYEELCYIGDKIYELRTSVSAYDAAVPEDLKRELDAIDREIVYGPGIGYPREWDELEGYLPRLCARYLPPEQLAAEARRGPIWNPRSRSIQEARQAGPGGGPR